MKQATVQISFDAEKLGAIKRYMGKKDAELPAELGEVMQRLYEKHVPAPVREYIESREAEEQEKSQKTAQPASSAAKHAGGTPA